MTETKQYDLCHMRLTTWPEYWRNQLNEFAAQFVGQPWRTKDSLKIKRVQFGKQDIRGGFSICLIDERNCIPRQKYFENKNTMLGFVQGWNMSAEGIKNFY